ncbi:MAG: hypothetical protein OEV08_11530 [Nitrospira sp.]|nr:hypothetical protein [Nitrospira sp.]
MTSPDKVLLKQIRAKLVHIQSLARQSLCERRSTPSLKQQLTLIHTLLERQSWDTAHRRLDHMIRKLHQNLRQTDTQRAA